MDLQNKHKIERLTYSF